MKPASRLSPLLLAALMAGCTLGPDFQRPDSQAPQQWAPLQGEVAASQPQAEPLELRWWESFHDGRLSALIQRVAERNLDLQMASARLLQSRALRSTVAADQVPSVDVNAGYSRARNSAEGLSDPSGKAGKEAFNLWQGDLVAGWELDLWGRVRRQVEAADATVEVAENDRRGVLLALLSETAGNYIQLRAVQHTIDVTRDNLKVAQHSLKLSENRQAEGVATRLDVAQANAQVASIESRLPTLEARRDDLINALSLLAAEPPRSLQAELLQGGELPAPQQKFAIGLPSELAERRPDIRQAEARLHAATASIGVAKADFYPSIRLSGNVGFQAMQLSDFGAWDSRRFAFGPQLSLPIFEGGRLKGTLELREAQQQEAALNYRKVVLGAWHEIDDVLRLYNASQLRRDHLAEAVRQNRIALETAQRQYVEGAVDFLNVLTVQGALLASEEQWIDSSAAVSQALVGLYKALGGGWQAFDEQPPAIPQTDEEAQMHISLNGKRAIVSGSTAGIGLAIAIGLAEAGAEVVLNGRTQARVDEALKVVRERLPQARIIGIAADLGTQAGAQQLFDQVPHTDILVNNLGIFEPKPFFEIEDEDWQRFFDVNVLSAVRLSRHYAQGMAERKWGRVVFLSSESALQIPTEMIHYGMTKTALLAVSRGLAETLAGTGVTVNSVLPGPTLSEGVGDFFAKLAEEQGVSTEELEANFLAEHRPTSLIKRLATVEEVANMVVYLASMQASATTGAALRVDGGVLRSIA